MTNKSIKQPKVYRVPKELDILPPRPVLFPWLPGGLSFKPCFGIGESSKSSSSSSSQPGTPATQPLSPTGSIDEFEDAMPDMSRVNDIPKHKTRKHPYAQPSQSSQQLDTLTDVIVEILRVICFIIKTKQALLKQNGEEPRQIPQLAAPSRQQSVKNTIDVV